jgi:hypothetical protein
METVVIFREVSYAKIEICYKFNGFIDDGSVTGSGCC